MRIPVKSETDAFRLAFGIAAVIGAAIAVGVLAGGLYGVVLFVGAIVGALVWELKSEDPDRSELLRDAAGAAPVDRGAHGVRVLVIANETVGGRELRSEILQGGRRPAELRVVCPSCRPARTSSPPTSTTSWPRHVSGWTGRSSGRAWRASTRPEG